MSENGRFDESLIKFTDDNCQKGKRHWQNLKSSSISNFHHVFTNLWWYKRDKKLNLSTSCGKSDTKLICSVLSFTTMIDRLEY